VLIKILLKAIYRKKYIEKIFSCVHYNRYGVKSLEGYRVEKKKFDLNGCVLTDFSR